jgi:hypothetical protein
MSVSTMEYLNIVGHFQGTYEALDGEIGITNFNYINSSICGANCLVTNVKNPNTKKNINSSALPWHKQF